jgi:hypothetical protein
MKRPNYRLLKPRPKCCATCSHFNFTDYECMVGVPFNTDTESYDDGGYPVSLFTTCDDYRKGRPYVF